MKKLLFVCLLVLVPVLFVACGGINVPSDINIYTMKLVYNDEMKTVSGLQTVSYVNKTDTALKKIMFHLYPNAFREGSKATVVSFANQAKAYPNGNSYGHIEIDLVTINAVECSFEIGGEDENILVVNLEKELFPDCRENININFTTYLANINHRLGYGEKTINICNFYPIACVYENGDFVTDLYHANGDPFYSPIADYYVEFSYDDDFKMASSGESEVLTQNFVSTATIKGLKIRDFAIVLSKNFEICSTNYNKTAINYFYYDDENYQTSLQIAKEAVVFFSEKIGEYPYSTLNIVLTNFVHGGMEYPNIVLISDQTTDYLTYQSIIVHEIGHQWWYGLVGNNQYSYGWMDEGLTEFSTALFFDNHPEYQLSKDQIIRGATTAYATFFKTYSNILGNINTSMNRKLSEFDTEPEYVYITYTKGMLMFSTIYNIIGETDFYKCMSNYFKSYIYQEALPNQMINSFVKSSKKEIEVIFNSWVEGKVSIIPYSD